MTPVIELKNVTKTYNNNLANEFKALKGVDLIVHQGEFVAIMGPSGSGKTTLMNMLGVLDIPTTGKYYINGTEVSNLTPDQLAEFRNKDVGFVFQQFNLLPRTTVLNNVLLPTLYNSSNMNKLERANQVLQKVGLADKAQNMSNQLSGGQIQRVAIARALVMNPSILIADEPTGNLDSKTADEIMRLFTQLNLEGNTVIIVTHEPDVAAYAKRIVRVKDGLIESSK